MKGFLKTRPRRATHLSNDTTHSFPTCVNRYHIYKYFEVNFKWVCSFEEKEGNCGVKSPLIFNKQSSD